MWTAQQRILLFIRNPQNLKVGNAGTESIRLRAYVNRQCVE
jgi:hypothetical protein